MKGTQPLERLTLFLQRNDQANFFYHFNFCFDCLDNRRHVASLAKIVG